MFNIKSFTGLPYSLPSLLYKTLLILIVGTEKCGSDGQDIKNGEYINRDNQSRNFLSLDMFINWDDVCRDDTKIR
jgi:hypothetical protein